MLQCLLVASLSIAAAWRASPATRAPLALVVPRRAAPRCSYWDDVDSLVLYGDAGVLIGYGVVQSAADAVLLPLATSQPELFTQSEPVLAAQTQGLILAALWVGITSSVRGYRPAATRTLPSRQSVIPLVAAWLGSTTSLVAAFALLGLPLDAELEFTAGSAAVVVGWRWLYVKLLPPP